MYFSFVNNIKDKNNLLICSAIIVAVTVLRLLYLGTNHFDLFFDEAQYWIWSRSFEFGYYSKPPVIAWLISLAGSVCGDTEFCIRAGSPLMHMGTSFIVYFIANELYDRKTAILSAITYLTLPAVSFSSTLISTDAPLLFFWAASTLFFIKAVKHDTWKYWIYAGIAAGLGMMTKYNMLVFLLSVIIYLVISQKNRNLLTSAKFWAAVGVAFVIFLPNIYWNFSNGFVSFLHTTDNASGGGPLFHPDKMFEFIGAQFGVFGPILFASLLIAIVKFKALIKNDGHKLLLCTILPLFAVICFVSFLSRAHANWAAPVYVPATILVIAWLLEKNRQNLIIASIVLHVIVALFFANIDGFVRVMGYSFAQNTNASEKKIADPFLRIRGWSELGQKVRNILAEYPESKLLTLTRKDHSEFVYYAKLRTSDAVKFNPSGNIKDHFDLTTNINDYADKDFIFVSRYDYINDLSLYFAHYKKLDNIVVKIYDDYKLDYHVYYLSGFKGYE